MNLGLGIDTGGTFTDAVIIEMDSSRILAKAKAATTRQDLRIGIGNALKALDGSLFPQVKLVSLSTTLATNSIVEGKGARVGLIAAVPKPEMHFPFHEYARPRRRLLSPAPTIVEAGLPRAGYRRC